MLCVSIPSSNRENQLGSESSCRTHQHPSKCTVLLQRAWGLTYSVPFDLSQIISHFPTEKNGGKKCGRWCACNTFISQCIKLQYQIFSCIKQIKKSKLYGFYTFSDLQMKGTVCTLLSWDKADLEHKKENVPVMCQRWLMAKKGGIFPNGISDQVGENCE